MGGGRDGDRPLCLRDAWLDAGVDVDVAGDEDDGEDDEEEEGVDGGGDAGDAEAAEVDQPVRSGQLEEQPRREQHEQRHAHHHRRPVHHPRSPACLSFPSGSSACSLPMPLLRVYTSDDLGTPVRPCGVYACGVEELA
jgi:hypothetical protein